MFMVRFWLEPARSNNHYWYQVLRIKYQVIQQILRWRWSEPQRCSPGYTGCISSRHVLCCTWYTCLFMPRVMCSESWIYSGCGLLIADIRVVSLATDTPVVGSVWDREIEYRVCRIAYFLFCYFAVLTFSFSVFVLTTESPIDTYSTYLHSIRLGYQ